ncbi:hypothetical protein ACHAXT_002792 [Thalassiosira profunda]
MKSALVCGISGDQGQAVAQGLLATGAYRRVYGATRDASAIAKLMSVPVQSDGGPGDDGGAAKSTTVIEADLNSAESLRRAFVKTGATDIFLVTTTEVPIEGAAMGSFHEAEELEFTSIKTFFDVLVDVHKKERSATKIERHVVFSTLDNVRGLVEWLETHQAQSNGAEETLDIRPLDDGGIVPHYSGKGRGGEYALQLIHGITDPWKCPPTSASLKSPWMNAAEPTSSVIPGLSVTLITLPFLHTNFALAAAPLPSTSEGRVTQWSISACLGDASHPVDMISVSDLRYIVPVLFEEYAKYQGRTIKLSGERITLTEVANQFSDLFGKDVIYSPLTIDEMSTLDIPGAPALAQMCQYLASPYADHDVDETKKILSKCGRAPQTFQDWLLSHSDEAAFEQVGLTLDAPPIQRVAVFNPLSPHGLGAIKGLLADSRKRYMISTCICGDAVGLEEAIQRLQSIDAERITVCLADLDDVQSCAKALEGADGAIVVTDFDRNSLQLPQDPEREEQEERRARVLIDACATAGTVKHLVLGTLDPVNDVDSQMKGSSASSTALVDVKSRVFAYACAKHISVTYVVLPWYSEQFFQALAESVRRKEGAGSEADATNEDAGARDIDYEKLARMSAESLGPAVANIFDSYEVYAGHEVGLIADATPSSGSVEEPQLAVYPKDLGHLTTLKLVPDAKPFKLWLEENRDNAEFRELLGIR